MSRTYTKFLLSVSLVLFFQSALFSQTNKLAETMQVDALWEMGLTGAGYNKIGMWGASNSVPYNHKEFEDRMINADGFNSNLATNHETSTAGIIISKGIDALAKGMAYQASLQVFDSKFTQTEVNTAASNGMELASFSWAAAPFYYFNERNLDEIAYKNKKFLLFHAGGAGIAVFPGPSGQGKNVLSVGSAQVLNGPYSGPLDVISGGSIIGPAHDGRIKPDIMAPGGSSKTCFINDAYGMTGPATSYSAPAAAGASVLLQQHFQNNNNDTPMQSSELKGLLIHTAEEAGPAPGPDAQFGWGLINAKRAADVITHDVFYNKTISTNILDNNGTFELPVYSDGSQPIKVTICWTDPAGEVIAPPFTDTSPRLINDLDLTIVKDGIPFYPWTLNPANPTGAAFNNTKNHLDNVEQVLIENPSEGLYTIEVNHGGTLSNDGILTFGSQAFSMIIGGKSSPTLTSPRFNKEQVLYDLHSAYLSSDNDTNGDIERAIRYLENSLLKKYWENDYLLTVDGRMVFIEEKKAVKVLEKILKKSDFHANEVYEIIMSLIGVDKALAQFMIDRAIDNNGNMAEIEKAELEMEKAEEELTGSSNTDDDAEDEDDNSEIAEVDKYDNVVFHYKKAWEHAFRALQSIGLAKTAIPLVTNTKLLIANQNFTLNENFPNPFNPITTISYKLKRNSNMSITLYNIKGEKVRLLEHGIKSKGNHTVKWNGTDDFGNPVSAGIYFYELLAGDNRQVRRMTYMK